MSFWTDNRFVVTGGSGFLGQVIVRKLQERGATEINVPRSAQYDLRHREAVLELLNDAKPDVIIHGAASVGGIGANQEHPADFFYDNLMMGVQLMHESWQAKIKKFAIIGTVCAYPKFTPVPFSEDAIWDGYPEETNAPYGLAKKMLLVQSQSYRQQYDFNSIFLLPTNLYGPGDNFNLHTSHVIPALIRKCIEAKERGDNHINAWGTGSASREFLYVDDAAEGILIATEQYNKSDPVNLGATGEVKIKDLLEMIVELTEFEGEIVWDTSKPDGQPRRALDTTRAEKEFGFKAQMPFREGLKRTIEWYLENKDAIAAQEAQPS